MRLDQELVKRGMCDSRTEAQEIISSGGVFVNDAVCTKQIKQVADEDNITVTARRKFVSRGGEKLEGALLYVFDNIKQFSISNFQFLNDDTKDNIRQFMLGKSVLDIGSSTGGFTDCLLSYGVSHVDAVDVGTAQLHEKIKNDSRVSVFENTDIRDFKSDKKYDIVVADLSFITLEKVLDNIISFGKNDTHYFLLIKPQFEVGKGNTKKGVVKNKNLIIEVLENYKNIAKENGMKNIKIFPCSITGGDGN
jgi:23S rRNA (cytidine1920-2'-O)/16S rRNA (cytidine1409-2'-O)-methyltransferase